MGSWSRRSMMDWTSEAIPTAVYRQSAAPTGYMAALARAMVVLPTPNASATSGWVTASQICEVCCPSSRLASRAPTMLPASAFETASKFGR